MTLRESKQYEPNGSLHRVDSDLRNGKDLRTKKPPSHARARTRPGEVYDLQPRLKSGLDKNRLDSRYIITYKNGKVETGLSREEVELEQRGGLVETVSLEHNPLESGVDYQTLAQAADQTPANGKDIRNRLASPLLPTGELKGYQALAQATDLDKNPRIGKDVRNKLNASLPEAEVSYQTLAQAADQTPANGKDIRNRLAKSSLLPTEELEGYDALAQATEKVENHRTAILRAEIAKAQQGENPKIGISNISIENDVLSKAVHQYRTDRTKRKEQQNPEAVKADIINTVLNYGSKTVIPPGWEKEYKQILTGHYQTLDQAYREAAQKVQEEKQSMGFLARLKNRLISTDAEKAAETAKQEAVKFYQILVELKLATPLDGEKVVRSLQPPHVNKFMR
ncbi:MAG: hypothetical protein WCW16_01760 [Candidatus Magasanikbacteria bacterium]